MNIHLFDDWPEKYEAWFKTAIGGLVLSFEKELVLDLLRPRDGERILDAGCGTGIFTADFLHAGALVTGMDLSLPMLRCAAEKLPKARFRPLQADMLSLPFSDDSFNKTVSVTALEFIADGRAAAAELFRVTKPGGIVVVATLNGLSSWAGRREEEAGRGRGVFQNAVFRSPGELLALVPVSGISRTCVFFDRDEDPGRAGMVEKEGRERGLHTGAFVAARWVKPG